MYTKAVGAALMTCSCLAIAAPSDWNVSDHFGAVDRASFDAGDVAIVALEARAKSDRPVGTRADYDWIVMLPYSTLSSDEQFQLGSKPQTRNNGAGYWWWNERLAFDYRTHEVHVLPRRGLSNDIAFEGGSLTDFWCRTGLAEAAPVVLDRYTFSPYNGRQEEVCPTSLLRSTKTKKGLFPRRELYQIDTAGISKLIVDMKLDDYANNARTQLAVAKQAQAKQAEALQAQIKERQQEEAQKQVYAHERAKTAYQRGQAIIAQAQIGEHLCTDITANHTEPAVIGAFLEAVKGSKVQLRINAITSASGYTTYTGPMRLDDGVSYAAGSVVWSRADQWRACE